MAYVALMVIIVFVSLFVNGVLAFKHSQLVKERDELLAQKSKKKEVY